MNIFVLHSDPYIAATHHNDKHVVKMILETTQMLFTVLNKMGFETPYRPTHAKHPCTIWASKSQDNFKWLITLGLALCNEYTFRYGKVHKCQEYLQNMIVPTADKFSFNGLTEFAQAMPDIYKDKNPILAYRKYYLGAKGGFMKYTKRQVPDWVKEKDVLLGIN